MSPVTGQLRSLYQYCANVYQFIVHVRQCPTYNIDFQVGFYQSMPAGVLKELYTFSVLIAGDRMTLKTD